MTSNSSLRRLLAISVVVALLPSAVTARQAHPNIQLNWEIFSTGSQSSFRGISSPTAKDIWLCGSQSTVLVSVDGGLTWQDRSPSYGKLEFRSIEAFNAQEACVASAGTPAVILRTTDAGLTWQETYRHQSPKAFFDGLRFWNAQIGAAFSDPVENKFLIVTTQDAGKSWQAVDPQLLPEVQPDEAAFAASNSAMLLGRDGAMWIGTGGRSKKSSRLLFRLSTDSDWQAAEVPLASGAAAGIFSLAQHPSRPQTLVAVGGDYRPGESSETTCAISGDAGKNWRLSENPPKAFRSAVLTWNIKSKHSSDSQTTMWICVGPSGCDYSLDGDHWVQGPNEGFHALSSTVEQVFACGAAGKFGKLTIAD
jgi:Photosynthesis system II assembly factor YCF48